MGTMNDPVDACGVALVNEGALRRVRVKAIAGTSQALVALIENGQEHLVWVQTICALTVGSVGRLGILAAAPAATGYILLGLLDARDESEVSNPSQPTNVIGMATPVATEAALPPSIFSVEGDTLVIQHGEACLELHTNGSIIFRGTHIASYSSGANRIRGTTIELN